MKGYPVGEASAASISELQKAIAMIMARPNEPFINILSIIDRGTTSDGFRTSSHICGILISMVWFWGLVPIHELIYIDVKIGGLT